MPDEDFVILVLFLNSFENPQTTAQQNLEFGFLLQHEQIITERQGLPIGCYTQVKVLISRACKDCITREIIYAKQVWEGRSY